MSKKAISFLVCLMVFISIGSTSLTASAATNIRSASSNVSISGGTAYVSCSLTGYQGTTTKCSISAYLQQYKSGSWVTVSSWSQSYSNYRGTLSASKTVAKGYNYRVLAYFYGTSASKTESISLTSNTIYY